MAQVVQITLAAVKDGLRLCPSADGLRMTALAGFFTCSEAFPSVDGQSRAERLKER
jgi:hypothetical protein